MKPFKNTIFPDENFELMITHLKAMEAYMIKVNTGQETPDNGRRDIFNEHFDEVKRLAPNLKVPLSIQMVMAEIYRTHPAFVDIPPLSIEQTPTPPPMRSELETTQPDFKTADELIGYVNALGNLALSAGMQDNFISEEDQIEIQQIIEIMENEPERLPLGFDIDEVKELYEGFHKIRVVNQYMHLVTIQMVFKTQNIGKKIKPH